MMETASFLENVINDMTLYNRFNYEKKNGRDDFEVERTYSRVKAKIPTKSN